MKPFRILLLDNTREESSFGSKSLVRCILQSSPIGSEVIVRRPPDSDLPKSGFTFNALVISGSATSCMEMKEPWIQEYDRFVTEQIKKNTPILGVCYGHQTLVRCTSKLLDLEPKFRKAKNAELGWGKIQVTSRSPLLEGLEESFYTYQSHYEEVYELPPGLVPFARSDRCEIQGYQLKEKPVFGIQFHPEYNADEGELSISKKIKKGEKLEWILNAGKGQQLYNEKVGKVIFGNFFRIANSQQ